jgi:hypothetical protein
MNGKVSSMLNREQAMSVATGISGGAAHTVPSLFFSDEGSELQKVFLNATLLPEEKIGEEVCYVISSNRPDGQETLWITKRDLFLKQSRKLKRANLTAENATVTEKISPETMRKLAKTLGLDESPEAFDKLTKQMETQRKQVGAVKIDVTETFERTGANDFMIKEDFEVSVPTDASVPSEKRVP